jgi:hypothetical protein
MMTWMQERKQTWDARCEDDMVWGAGITNMIAKTMKAVEQGQEEREKGREVTARTDSGGLGTSQHADMTQEEGPEEHQQPQQHPKPKPKLQLKLQLKQQLKQHPTPKPMSAPIPTRGWETVPPRAKSQRAPVGRGPVPGAGPAPMAGSSMAVRRMILRRDESVPLSNNMDQEIVSAINSALFHQKALAHIRIMNTKRNAKGTITVIAHPNTSADIAMQFPKIIITAARTVHRGVLDVEENETCERLKLHVVPLVRYMGKGTDGLQEMRGEF